MIYVSNQKKLNNFFDFFKKNKHITTQYENHSTNGPYRETKPGW